MTTRSGTGAILIHPQADRSGNLLWPGSLPEEHSVALTAALEAMRAQGYWASAFPEGDGVAFQWHGGTPYAEDSGLAALGAAFDFLEIEVLDPGETAGKALARLAASRLVACTYLVPVEGLRLEDPFTLGDTRFHAPVDGEYIRLADHAWSELCDVPGADVNSDWAPDDRASGTTELLGRSLIERRITVPMSLIYEAESGFDGQSALLRRLMEDADHALDPIRYDRCNYRRLEYLPAKPGWLGEFALAYLVPDEPAHAARLFAGKPYVLRVHNNWLGLDVDRNELSWAEPLAAMVVDNDDTDGITLALRSALRALNRAFYLVELEASFLHLVYAIDALCEPDRLRGDRHRLWISAFACGGKPGPFAKILDDFDRHYTVRNSIVHQGATFASLGLEGEAECQFMLDLLASCIQTIAMAGLSTRHEAADFAFAILTSPTIAPLVAAKASKHFTLPLTTDKGFAEHMRR